MTKRKKKLAKTVGELKALLNELPDDAVIIPDWQKGPPSDHEPGVVLYGFKIGTCIARQVPCLNAMVGLFYLGGD